MSGLRIWLMAARPRTLPAAIAPVLVGSAAAYEAAGDFRWGAFVAALVGSIFIQIGTNLANDYSDAKRGADTEDRLGPVRVTSSGLVAPRRVLVRHLARVRGRGRRRDLPGDGRRAGDHRGRRRLDRSPASSTPAARARTATPAWASCSSSCSSALVAVNGSYYVQLEELDWLPFWLSISVGLLSTAILVVNNIRDLETDRRAGKRTLAVRIGRERTRVLYAGVRRRLVRRPRGRHRGRGRPRPGVSRRCWPRRSPGARCRRCSTRTDGPALNAALAGTGALLGVFSLLVSAGLLIASVKLTEVEVDPVRASVRAPVRDRPRDARAPRDAARELITDEGLVGLGEAVPLSLRGGADLAAVERGIRKGTRRLRRADLSDFAGAEPTLAAVDAFIHTVAGRRIPAPAKAAIEMAVFDLAGKASGRRSGRCSARPRRPRCHATRPWWRARPTKSPPTPSAGPRAASTTFKLKLGTGDDVAQVRAVRERRRGRGPHPRRRQRRPGASTRRSGSWPMLEPLGVELAEQPVASAADLAQVTGSSTDPDRRRRERRHRQGRRAGEARARPATWPP